MRSGTTLRRCLFMMILLVWPLAPAEAQAPDTRPANQAPQRTVIIGGKVLMGFVNRGDRPAIPVWRDDIVVEMVAGRVMGLTSEADYRALPGDVRIPGRGRYFAPAPIVTALPGQDAQWLSGSSLMRAIVHGVGHVVVSKDTMASPAGRCAEYRVAYGETPGALPVTPQPRDPEDTGEQADEEDSEPKRPEPKPLPDFRVDLPDRRLTSAEFQQALMSAVEALRKTGEDDAAIFRGMTSEAGVRIGRDDLGGIRYLATAAMVACTRDPLEDLSAIFDPDLVILGNRVMRRAEIEVLRDAVDRSIERIRTTTELVPGGKAGNPVHRWLSSVEGQVFGGLAIQAGEDGRLDFSARQGQPRFDAITGWLRSGEPGETVADLSYDGPPESFKCTMTRGEHGLDVVLNVSDRPSRRVDAPGPTGPPMFDPPIDLHLRAKAILAGARELDGQEFIFGNGPIAMAPRRLRFTAFDVNACPPCFEGYEAVFQVDVLDPDSEVAETSPEARMLVAFRDGEPVRILVDSGDGPSWYDRMFDAGVTID